VLLHLVTAATPAPRSYGRKSTTTPPIHPARCTRTRMSVHGVAGWTSRHSAVRRVAKYAAVAHPRNFRRPRSRSPSDGAAPFRRVAAAEDDSSMKSWKPVICSEVIVTAFRNRYLHTHTQRCAATPTRRRTVPLNTCASRLLASDVAALHLPSSLTPGAKAPPSKLEMVRGRMQ